MSVAMAYPASWYSAISVLTIIRIFIVPFKIHMLVPFNRQIEFHIIYYIIIFCVPLLWLNKETINIMGGDDPETVVIMIIMI